MDDEPKTEKKKSLYNQLQNFAAAVCVRLCVLLTQRGVVKGEVPQVSGVLRQGEQAPGVTVPHQAASGAVLQHTVLDDLETQAWKQITRCSTNKTPRVSTSHPKHFAVVS